MRNLTLLDAHRRRDRHVIENWGWVGDGTCGMFEFPSPIDKRSLRVIASSGEGWDHVSVSRENRCPNWQEMEFVAGLFFKDDETAFQLHLPSTDHINNHPYCLHWWRPQKQEIPRPPGIMVGVRHLGVLTPEKVRQHKEEVDRAIAAKMEAL